GHIRHQLGLVSLRIVDQISGMDFEEFRQQHAAGVGQVRARAALDLRKVALADRLAQLFLDQARDFELREFAVESAQGSFHLPEIAKFLAQSHIAIRNEYMANCDSSQEGAPRNQPQAGRRHLPNELYLVWLSLLRTL